MLKEAERGSHIRLLNRKENIIRKKPLKLPLSQGDPYDVACEQDIPMQSKYRGLVTSSSHQAPLFRPCAISTEESAYRRLSLTERNVKILIVITVVKIAFTIIMMLVTVVSDD